MTEQQLFSQALGLPASQRAQLAARLMRSLDEDEADDVGISEAWDAEIRQRLAELETGEAELISKEDFFRDYLQPPRQT